MAQTIEEIKASFTPPTHDNINGVQVELSSEEAQEFVDKWADAELARQLDEEANGYKVARQMAYPALTEQFDKLWHDINNGTLDNTGAFYTALKTVKDNNPKPGE